MSDENELEPRFVMEVCREEPDWNNPPKDYVMPSVPDEMDWKFIDGHTSFYTERTPELLTDNIKAAKRFTWQEAQDFISKFDLSLRVRVTSDRFAQWC